MADCETKRSPMHTVWKSRRSERRASSSHGYDLHLPLVSVGISDPVVGETRVQIECGAHVLAKVSASSFRVLSLFAWIKPACPCFGNRRWSGGAVM